MIRARKWSIQPPFCPFFTSPAAVSSACEKPPCCPRITIVSHLFGANPTPNSRRLSSLSPRPSRYSRAFSASSDSHRYFA